MIIQPGDKEEPNLNFPDADAPINESTEFESMRKLLKDDLDSDSNFSKIPDWKQAAAMKGALWALNSLFHSEYLTKPATTSTLRTFLYGQLKESTFFAQFPDWEKIAVKVGVVQTVLSFVKFKETQGQIN